MSATALFPLENIKPELFSGGDALTKLLDRIEQQALAEVFDMAQPASRKACASLAHKIARSKTALDGVGKDLVADIKKQTSEIDGLRKGARDRLDDLKAKVRAPLDEWEAEQERIRLEAEEAERRRIKEEERQRLAQIEAREREVREREAELARREAEAKAAEEARLEAERAVEREKAEAERREREAKEQAEREEKIRAEAAEKARREAEEAAARAEQERQAKKAAEKAAAEKRAANARRRSSVNVKAVTALLSIEGMTDQLADRVVKAIANGDIPDVSVNY